MLMAEHVHTCPVQGQPYSAHDLSVINLRPMVADIRSPSPFGLKTNCYVASSDNRRCFAQSRRDVFEST